MKGIANQQRQQSIRLGNTLLAAAGGFVLSAICGYANYSGDLFIPSWAFYTVLSIFWTVNIAFILTVKFGLNLRFREAALTLPQMLWASTSCMVAVAISQFWDGAIYLLALLTMVFGVFRIPLKTFNLYCGYLITLSLCAVVFRHFFMDSKTSLASGLIFWITFSFCAVALSRLCSSLMVLRNRLRKKNDELAEALEVRSFFLANMSHEIRTPLNGVLGMIDVVMNSDLPKDQQRFLSIAQSSAQKLLGIVNDILDFSKMDEGKLSLEKTQFAVRPFVQEVIQAHRFAAEAKNLHFSVDVEHGVPERIEADPKRIRQVLQHLLDNAIKFTAAGEITLNVSVNASALDTSLIWQVKDTGIGIDPNQRTSIFEAFTQVDASTTRSFGGTGMGLAVCHRLCALMGGEVSFDSQLGRGSNFVFAHPVSIVKVIDDRNIDTFAKENKVLFVDQNRSLCSVFAVHAEREHVDITFCTRIEDAISILESQEDEKFNLILISARDPHVSVEEFMQIIASLPSSNKADCILLNEFGNHEEPGYLQALGFREQWVKPIFWDDLLGKLLQWQGEQVNREGISVPDEDTYDQGGRERKTVLLVEDNPANQEFSKLILKDYPVNVLLAENGKEAISMLEDSEAFGSFDLVLMDCQMPVMDGYDATRAIRRHSSDHIRRLPVVAMTANAMEGDREKCLAAGMTDYLSKPIDCDAFDKMIVRYLGLKPIVVDVCNEVPRVDEVWDSEALLTLLRNKKERMIQILKPFVGRLDDEIDSIIEHLDSGNVTDAVHQMHALRGAVAHLGGTKLAEYLLDAERELKGDGIADMSDWQAKFRNMAKTLKQSMKDYLDSQRTLGKRKNG